MTSAHSSSSGFQGLWVGALESRMAVEMEKLIHRHGGHPLVAPSMKERPLSEHSQALEFGKSFLRDEYDMLILLTGVGFRTLVDILLTQDSLEKITQALHHVTLVVRGPKPLAVVKELGLQPQITVPEPNTWRDLLSTLDTHYPEGLREMRVAIQEYGVTNTDLIEGLRTRGALVTPVPVYRWTLPDDLGPLTHLCQQILEGSVPVLLITNAVQVDHLFQILDASTSPAQLKAALHNMMVVSIGHVASERLKQYGLTPDLEPSHPKMGTLVKEASQQAHEILATKQGRSTT